MQLLFAFFARYLTHQGWVKRKRSFVLRIFLRIKYNNFLRGVKVTKRVDYTIITKYIKLNVYYHTQRKRERESAKAVA